MAEGTVQRRDAALAAHLPASSSSHTLQLLDSREEVQVTPGGRENGLAGGERRLAGLGPQGTADPVSPPSPCLASPSEL